MTHQIGLIDLEKTKCILNRASLYTFVRAFVAIIFFLTLAETSQSQNDTLEPVLFTLLSPNESNIDFINIVRDTEESNIISHPNHWNGGGIALGDLNNDGFLDIYFSGNEVPDRLYLNNGDLRFTDISQESGLNSNLGWRTGVCMVDVNKDGYLDIYVCRAGLESTLEALRENLLFINNGDLTFTESAKEFGLNDAGFSIHATFFDMDNDGDLDAFVINNDHSLSFGSNIDSEKITADGTNHLYLNDGNGRFTEVGASRGIHQLNALSLSVSSTDLNKDGRADLYVTNDLKHEDHVYINQGGGIFKDQGDIMFKHFSMNAMGADIADVNNDELVDVLVVDMFPEESSRQKNQAGISNDYFESMVRRGYKSQFVRNTLSLNNGNGTFSDIAHLAGVAHTDWSWCPLIMDLDNDGFKDILITNSLRRNILDNDFRVYKMDSIIRFAMDNLKTVLYQELDKTEKLKLQNYVYKNNGDLTFSQKMIEWGLVPLANTTSAAYGDLDNDGDLDLVFNNIDSVSWIYRNNSNRSSSAHYFRVLNDTFLTSVSMTIYHGQNRQFLELNGARGYQASSEQVFHFGLGTQTEIDSLVINSGLRSWVVKSQLQIDKSFGLSALLRIGRERTSAHKKLHPWLIENTSNEVLKFEHQENQFDDFKREPLLYERHSSSGPRTCIGDVNNDKIDDIFVTGSMGSAGKLFLGQADGRYVEQNPKCFDEHKMFEDGGCAFIDVDSDGFLDLYVASSGYELEMGSSMLRDRLYMNDKRGNFSFDTLRLPTFLDNVTSVSAVDYDADGRIEIFLGGGALPSNYPLSSPSRMLRVEKGKLVDITDRIAPELKSIGLVNDATWANLDSDKEFELIISADWQSPIVFDGYKKRLRNVSATIGLSNMNGFWKTIVAADVNADGYTDLLFGNVGSNCRLKASSDEPITLYVSDIDGNGRLDPLLTYYIQGKEEIIHTRDVLLDQVIPLKRRFLSYKSYSMLNVKDVLGNDMLADSKKYQVQEMRSLVLLNNGQGQFIAEPMPVEAQVFPVRNIISKDFDLDGKVDLAIAGNSTDAHYTYGKDNSGIGLVLKGTGQGQFEALASTESGVNMPGDVTDMVLLPNPLGNDRILVLNLFGKAQVFDLNNVSP